MNYQSPIEIIQTQLQNQIEEEIYKAVVNVGVSVDKEELIKALRYDRNQYQKGYADRDLEIVRCKDCTYYTGGIDGYCDRWFRRSGGNMAFCSEGEREKQTAE